MGGGGYLVVGLWCAGGCVGLQHQPLVDGCHLHTDGSSNFLSSLQFHTDWLVVRLPQPGVVEILSQTVIAKRVIIWQAFVMTIGSRQLLRRLVGMYQLQLFRA
jgi:hypothetical protein